MLGMRGEKWAQTLIVFNIIFFNVGRGTGNTKYVERPLMAGGLGDTLW